MFQNGYQECAEIILRQFPTELDCLISLSCSQKISEDKVSHLTTLCMLQVCKHYMTVCAPWEPLFSVLITGGRKLILGT